MNWCFASARGQAAPRSRVVAPRPAAVSRAFALVLALLWLAACRPTVSEAPLERPRLHTELSPARLADPRPIRLLARDGTDLPLVALELRGVVEDPLAFTELHLEFENPEPRRLDARLELRLPADAQLARFAALIEGSWREAEVVEREPGQLRPSLHEPAEPLAATEAGEPQLVVSLPRIPARSQVKLIVAYTERFADVDRPYRVRLDGLRDVARFSARVSLRGHTDPELDDWTGGRLANRVGADASGRKLIEFSRLDWTASGDLVIPTSGLRRTGVRSGRSVVARLTPLTHDHAAPIAGLAVAFDTSASQAVGYDERVERLAALLGSLAPWTGDEIRIHILAFDQTLETVYDGPLKGLDRGVFEQLRARRALGASNLVAALRGVARASQAGEPAEELAEELGTLDRLLLVSDGLATAGASGRAAMRSALGELEDAGIRRVDVLVDAPGSESRRARQLIGELPETGLVLTVDTPPRGLVRRLLRTVHDNVRITVPGARWFFPEVVDGVQSEDEILVYADVLTAADGLRVLVDSHGQETLEIPLVDVDAPLVASALERARVDFLVTTLEDKSEGQSLDARHRLWRRIVRSSLRTRVVNDYTTLAVLADSDDYAAARLDPAELPDVLVAGPQGVLRRQRGLPNALRPATQVPLATPRLPRVVRRTLAAEHRLALVPDGEIGLAPAGARSPDERPLRSSTTAPGTDATVRAVAPTVDQASPQPSPQASPELQRMRRAKPLPRRVGRRPRSDPPARAPEDAYRGNLLAVMNLIAWGDLAEAEQLAWRWREAEPTEVMAVVALGEALEANARPDAAARAYGSIIDLFPGRADMRRFAGSRLEHLGRGAGRLAVDTYRRAREQRPDHPSSHRLLAFSLLRTGRAAQAFDVVEAGLARSWTGEFAGVDRVLREDLGLIAAVWLAAAPEAASQVRARLERAGAEVEVEPSLRFVLTWETGGNDVDLHVRDVLGSHAYYESRGLRSGGALYYDVTRGYGPELFTILGQPTGYPYNLQVHYYARGPSGYGMGKVEIIEHNGRGGVAFDQRPFVVMKDRAYVDLGDLEGSLLR